MAWAQKRAQVRSQVRPMVGRRGGVFNPATVADAFYDVSDLSTLFQNANGTGAVTAENDPVRYIGDKSGKGNHLTILTTGTPGILKKSRGKWVVRCGIGAAFKTTGNKTLSTPVYLCAGVNATAAADQPIFGVIRSALQLAVLRGYSAQNKVQSFLNDNSTGILALTGPYNSGPLNAPLVADGLHVSGASDIFVDGDNSATIANAWTGSVISSTAIYGLNMATNTLATTGMTCDFYGGLIMHRDPGVSLRAQIVAYFKAKVQRAPVATDNNILVIGDSTGDGWPGSIDPKEWPWFFAANKLATDDPTAYVGIKLYAETIKKYTPEVIVQEGTGGPSWVIYNGSVVGRMPQFFTGDQFPGSVQNIPRPSVIMWNHGHNINNLGGASIASFPSRFIGPMDQIRQQWPGVPHMAIRQNPWLSSTSMSNLVAALDDVVSLYGDIPTADVYQGYIDYVPSKSSTLYRVGTDEIHPSELGVTDVWLPKIAAMWNANWPMPAAAPAFVATKVANLLTNGHFLSVTGGIPDGWTKIGDGTVTEDFSILDGSDVRSIKIVNGATVATKLRQTISAVPYRGGSVSLATRQYVVPGAGDASAGQIKISSDGTGSPTGVDFCGLTTFGSGGWRWFVITLDNIPADATTLTIDLQAADVSGSGNGTVYYGRAVLASGRRPRDTI